MFQLNQRVCSKQTGLPMCGTVVGYAQGSIYKIQMEMNGYIAHTWDNIYPDWMEKLVYWILFDQPNRLVSFEEYLNCLSNQIKEEYSITELKGIYKKEIPIRPFAYYPEDDLESLEN